MAAKARKGGKNPELQVTDTEFVKTGRGKTKMHTSVWVVCFLNAILTLFFFFFFTRRKVDINKREMSRFRDLGAAKAGAKVSRL